MAAADPLDHRLIRAIADHFGPAPPARICVAVSGGSDSLAALHLLQAYASDLPTKLFAVTVDHGLRKDAADEAQLVAKMCRALAVPHETLNWVGWSGAGNMQNAARQARYALMSDWAQAKQIKTIVLGHTQDDQAETVLMRLARGAGVDGLSAMSASRCAHGVTWARPLLNQRRDDLRAYLTSRGVPWIDDPSNDDPRFDRVKMREALGVLGPLGITVPHLAQVAKNMQQARTALSQQTHSAARTLLRCDAGGVVMDWEGFLALPDETARRLMNGVLGWIGGSDYTPRGGSLSELLVNLKQGKPGTLDGCHALRQKGALWVFREYQQIGDHFCVPDAVWDNRWRLTKPEAVPSDSTIRALGDQGLKLCPDWRETGRPRHVLRSSPSLWSGADLLAAPWAGIGPEDTFTLLNDTEDLFAALLSH